ncbi:hypothetical protein VTK73DRAFT_10179 [Phialemonium thermophilum]|uniref:BZIP domain-containing protein n=1 Tax=Phialemonium thermophilum TaxID=223376 RepID=A0ABR3VY28_9PEZI
MLKCPVLSMALRFPHPTLVTLFHPTHPAHTHHNLCYARRAAPFLGNEPSVPERPNPREKGSKRMTGSRVYIERDSCGNPRWIIRRHSHSYHRHHHPHRDWADERAHITNGELEKLKQRERELFEANDALVRENESLKANLRAAEDELQRHRTWVAELQQQVRQLTTENADLRRCLEEERQRHQHDGSWRTRTTGCAAAFAT